MTANVYEYDPNGTRQENKINKELHTITTHQSGNFSALIPKAAPYFENSIVIQRVSDGTILTKGIDYVPSYRFAGASNTAPFLEIFGAVSILNLDLIGVDVYVTYQTVGGNFTLPDVDIATILANAILDPRQVSWDDVTYDPGFYTPDSHLHTVTDTVGYEELVIAFNRLADTWTLEFSSISNMVQAHLSDGVNPHNVTAATVGLARFLNVNAATIDDFEDGSNVNYVSPAVLLHALSTIDVVADKAGVGLGNVENFSVSNQAEAEAGALNNRYMTPLRTAQAIAALAPTSSAESVGLGLVNNFSIATSGDAIAATSNTTYMTPLRTKELIDNNVTKSTVNLADVQNFGIASSAEALAGVSSSKYMTPLRTKEAVVAHIPKATEADIDASDALSNDIKYLTPIRCVQLVQKLGIGGEATEHNANTNNPHGTTKVHVGLSDVQNYGIASKVEAEAGLSNVKYMTPLRTKEAIEELVVIPEVNKTTLGLDQVANLPLASQAEAEAGTASDRYMTPERTAQAIAELVEHPDIPTRSDLEVDQVQNYPVANQTTAEAGISNDEYMTPLRTSQAIGAQTLNKLTLDSSMTFASNVHEVNTLRVSRQNYRNMYKWPLRAFRYDNDGNSLLTDSQSTLERMDDYTPIPEVSFIPDPDLVRVGIYGEDETDHAFIVNPTEVTGDFDFEVQFEISHGRRIPFAISMSVGTDSIIAALGWDMENSNQHFVLGYNVQSTQTEAGRSNDIKSVLNDDSENHFYWDFYRLKISKVGNVITASLHNDTHTGDSINLFAEQNSGYYSHVLTLDLDAADTAGLGAKFGNGVHLGMGILGPFNGTSRIYHSNGYNSRYTEARVITDPTFQTPNIYYRNLGLQTFNGNAKGYGYHSDNVMGLLDPNVIYHDAMSGGLYKATESRTDVIPISQESLGFNLGDEQYTRVAADVLLSSYNKLSSLPAINGVSLLTEKVSYSDSDSKSFHGSNMDDHTTTGVVEKRRRNGVFIGNMSDPLYKEIVTMFGYSGEHGSVESLFIRAADASGVSDTILGNSGDPIVEHRIGWNDNIYYSSHDERLYHRGLVQLSDAKLKEEVEDYSDVNLDDLELKTWRWVEESDFVSKLSAGSEDSGVIAQAVLPLFPHCVSSVGKDDNITYSVDYGKLGVHAALMSHREVKKLRSEVDELKTQLAAKDELILDILERLEALESNPE